MNLHKIKLALTVDFLNSPISDNPLKSAQALMAKYKSEAGDYRRTFITNKTILNDHIEHIVHAIEFENCTLDLNLVSDRHASKSLIQGFDLHENIS